MTLGEAGFFEHEGKPCGGFLSWTLSGKIAALWSDGSRRHICTRRTFTIARWWLTRPGSKEEKAVFCKVIKGRLIPLQTTIVKLPEYAPGKMNKELIFEEENENANWHV